MYPDIPSGFGLTRMHWTAPGGTGHSYVILGFANPTGATAEEEANAVDTGYTITGGLNAFFAADANYVGNQVVLNTGGTFTEWTTSVSVAGGYAGDVLAPNTAVIIRKTTLLHGRNFRGRFFHPYVASAMCDADSATLNTLNLTGMQASATLTFNTWVLNGVQPQIFHRSLTVPPTEVQALEVEQELGTQRRRLRKAAHR